MLIPLDASTLENFTGKGNSACNFRWLTTKSFMNIANNISITFLLIPTISGLVGWVTIWITVRLLFYPTKPLSVAGYRWQGALPRYQQEVAERVARLVAEEIRSNKLITMLLLKVEEKEELQTHILSKISTRFFEMLPNELPMFAMFITPDIKLTLEKAIAKMLSPLLVEVAEVLELHLGRDGQIQQLVESRIRNLDSSQLAKELLFVFRKQLRTFGWVGGAVGTLLGIVQALLIYSIG